MKSAVLRLEKINRPSIAHLSVVHHRQRRGLTTGDTDGHFALQAAGHSAGRGLVRCGSGTHLTTVVVAPRVHLPDRTDVFRGWRVKYQLPSVSARQPAESPEDVESWLA